jgi:hypothetical protein
VLNQLRLCVREDPFRVHFPVLDCNSYTATKEFSEVTKIRQLSAGVHEVCVDKTSNRYVYKEVDNSLYQPRDSQVLDQELRNLKLFHGTKGVVETDEAYVSDQSDQSKETDQSDQTIKTTPSTVLRGVLLEYHPKGTLADAL